MRHLKELILLSILIINLFILYGCVKHKDTREYSLGQNFSPYFFAVKNPSKEDWYILNSYIREFNYPTNIEAAIMLGGYYVKKGELEKAKTILENNLSKIGSVGFTKLIGYMWLYYVYLQLDYQKKANEKLIKINEYKGQDFFEKALKAFCISISEPIGSINYSCLDRLSEKSVSKKPHEKIIKLNYDNKSIESNLQLNYQISESIFVDKKSINQKMVDAMIYAINKFNLNYHIIMDGGDGAGHNIYLYKEDNEILLNYYGKQINFGWDYLDEVNNFYDNVPLDRKKMILIIVSDEFKQVGKYLAKLYNNNNYNAKLLLYTDEGYKYDLKALENKYDDNVTFINIGNEDEIVNYMPLIRFFFNYETDVFSIISYFTGLYLKNIYNDYFNNSYVVAQANLTKDESKIFIKEFENFMGYEPAIWSFIGYDVICFLKNKNNNLNNNYNGYLTDVIYISDSSKNVERNFYLFYINNNVVNEIFRLLNFSDFIIDNL